MFSVGFMEMPGIDNKLNLSAHFAGWPIIINISVGLDAFAAFLSNICYAFLFYFPMHNGLGKRKCTRPVHQFPTNFFGRFGSICSYRIARFMQRPPQANISPATDETKKKAIGWIMEKRCAKLGEGCTNKLPDSWICVQINVLPGA